MSYEVSLEKAKVIHQGVDVTIAAFSYMTFESLIAARALLSIMGIGVEVIDMRSIRPLDAHTVIKSIEKTGRLIVADTAYKTGSIAAELITQVVEEAFEFLRAPPIRICSPDFPTPTAASMTLDYYPTPTTIARTVLKIMGRDEKFEECSKLMQAVMHEGLHDVPNREFSGPF